MSKISSHFLSRGLKIDWNHPITHLILHVLLSLSDKMPLRRKLSEAMSFSSISLRTDWNIWHFELSQVLWKFNAENLRFFISFSEIGKVLLFCYSLGSRRKALKGFSTERMEQASGNFISAFLFFCFPLSSSFSYFSAYLSILSLFPSLSFLVWPLRLSQAKPKHTCWLFSFLYHLEYTARRKNEGYWCLLPSHFLFLLRNISTWANWG